MDGADRLTRGPHVAVTWPRRRTRL
jgi:hypothetical protein